MKWWGNQESIWVSTVPRTLTSVVGRVSDIRFVNVRSRAAVNGAVLSSTTPYPIKGVTFTNVSLTVVPPTGVRRPGCVYQPVGHDYRPSLPGHPSAIASPVAGLYMEHALGTSLSNVRFNFEEGEGNGPDFPFNLPGWSPAGNWSTCLNGTEDSMRSLQQKGVQCNAPHMGSAETHRGDF